MKIVIPGGTGQVGTQLARALLARGDEVVVLGRGASGERSGVRHVTWDGKSLGPWAAELEGADAVINLAGRNVSCRYTPENLAQMLDSRVDSTRVVGRAIAACSRPPRVWLQMSTATIYAHTDGPPHGEDGELGGSEPGVPAYWSRSIEIARAWERAQAEAVVPQTRKVALRTAMVMSPDPGGVFDTLLRLVRAGLGGPVAGGRQYMSWIDEADFVRAVLWLIAHDDATGVFNLAAPGALPQREFMAGMRSAWGIRLGLPATRWMSAVGAWALRTDTELLLKSRRVAPARLLAAGFRFEYPDWSGASVDLVARWRSFRGQGGESGTLSRAAG